jgi:hypothetical protein
MYKTHNRGNKYNQKRCVHTRRFYVWIYARIYRLFCQATLPNWPSLHLHRLKCREQYQLWRPGADWPLIVLRKSNSGWPKLVFFSFWWDFNRLKVKILLPYEFWFLRCNLNGRFLTKLLNFNILSKLLFSPNKSNISTKVSKKTELNHMLKMTFNSASENIIFLVKRDRRLHNCILIALETYIFRSPYLVKVGAHTLRQCSFFSAEGI